MEMKDSERGRKVYQLPRQSRLAERRGGGEVKLSRQGEGSLWGKKRTEVEDSNWVKTRTSESHGGNGFLVRDDCQVISITGGGNGRVSSVSFKEDQELDMYGLIFQKESQREASSLEVVRRRKGKRGTSES